MMQISLPRPAPTLAHLVCASLLLAAGSFGCATATIPRPGEPLVVGEPTWPEDVTRTATRSDRACSAREAQLRYDYKEGQDEAQKFKTALGSISGAVGTVGGAVGGVGAFVIDSPDTIKTVTGATGFITAGLGAVGSVLTAVYTPGKDKMEASMQSLAAIDQKKTAARAALAKDPASWSDADREAWSKAARELDAACKP